MKPATWRMIRLTARAAGSPAATRAADRNVCRLHARAAACEPDVETASKTAPDAALRRALAAAFRATTYRVDTDAGAFELRIGERNTAFATFLNNRCISRWAIVTACNPGARHCDAAHNAILQSRLRARLQADGWTPGRNLFPALNRANRGDWPDEPGWLLLGIGRARARALAQEFGQLACVYGEMSEMCAFDDASHADQTGETSRKGDTTESPDSASRSADPPDGAPRLLWSAGR